MACHTPPLKKKKKWEVQVPLPKLSLIPSKNIEDETDAKCFC